LRDSVSEATSEALLDADWFVLEAAAVDVDACVLEVVASVVGIMSQPLASNEFDSVIPTPRDRRFLADSRASFLLVVTPGVMVALRAAGVMGSAGVNARPRACSICSKMISGRGANATAVDGAVCMRTRSHMLFRSVRMLKASVSTEVRHT